MKKKQKSLRDNFIESQERLRFEAIGIVTGDGEAEKVERIDQ